MTTSNSVAEVTEAIQMIWPGQKEFLLSEAETTALLTGAGYGKCLAKGEQVRYVTGEAVNVEDVKIGDMILGPGGPRKVLATRPGYGPLYRITLINGDSHVVNSHHIITLVCSGTKEYSKFKDGDIIDVPLPEYLGWGPAQKKRFKMYKERADFTEKLPPTIDPYVLGLMLGDGCLVETPVCFTTMSQELLDEVTEEATRWGCLVTCSDGHKTAPCYRIVRTNGTASTNPFFQEIKALGLGGTRSGSKFVPTHYKTGSRETRLQVLAGLMDTDGSAMKACYDYISKSKQLAEDVVFMARSLGFRAHMRPCQKSCQTGTGGTYYRVTLSDCSEIPSRIKKLEERKQIKHSNRYGFTVESCGDGEYYGFQLDVDQRFLLADFTVTHNSRVLCERIMLDHAKMDYWWKGRAEFNTQPIIFMVGAAHEAYLAENTVPMFRAVLDGVEHKIGRTIRKKTGRDRDGWFGAVGHRRQEMGNCVDVIIKAFPTKENAVAVTCAGLYFDEVTMLSDIEIWRRSQQRVREPRAPLRADGRPLHSVACVGTPEEDHFIHEVLIDPITKLPYPGTKVIMGSSLTNPVLPMRWFENQAHSSHLFKEMQVMGRWVRGAGGQRFAHVFRDDHHIVHLAKPSNTSALKYDLGWDPGYRTGSVVIMWQRPRDNAWFVVDEIVIENKTTYEVCHELLRRGYNHRNIRMIGMDPRDANKERSTSRVTDHQIVLDLLKVRPKIHHVGEKAGELYVRLDVIEELLKNDKLFINDSLKPRSMQQLGLVNSLKNFATMKTNADPEKFVDKPTRDTKERWKHPIDAIHYVLMHYERGSYTKVVRTPNRDQLGGIRG